MKTSDYIEALRPLTPTGSMYAIAKLLDVTEQAVHGYAHGKRQFDSYAAFRVAELLNLPPAQVLADAESEREKDSKRRVYWEDMARKLAGSTAVFLIATGTCGGFFYSTPASASKAGNEVQNFILCKIRQLRRNLQILQLRHLDWGRFCFGHIAKNPVRQYLSR